ncbi:PhzF family phenazine biosynthesis protein [Sulfurimonas lithotrophica]|uniref:PhzF family phenazine biosynthesis protein n=1 Tax=Sulfurimonas lithotrophica TaxID=2590022 RepID=A0A5P8P040_9BACT|nr:PhzF family phenazine biosynthesis protein [Sulfurimonas lithotrophica]QFR49054.1 PhzF family phenazine biosynthesis protein [Sulfurimonas lithotrophica]
MTLDMYQIDAFASKVFEGNPAAVIPLKEWLDDALMQKIAQENNLSETVFFVKEDEYYHIRWFTPNTEVDMCGHATLASAYVLFELLSFKDDVIAFNSKSGILKVKKEDKKYVMDFPAQTIDKCEIPKVIINAFDKTPIECYKSMDYLVVFENEQDILDAKVNLQLLKELDLRGVIITSKSSNYDFVCRFFAPSHGIDEDPVTGSAYTQLVPYWSDKLNKNTFASKQVSQRGGEVFCKLDADKVEISGEAVKYLEGKISI